MDSIALEQRVKLLERFSPIVEKDIFGDPPDPNDQWGSTINSEKLANARTSHNRDTQEYIFFLNDLTFWGSANNSIIATENGISAKYSDELEPLFISWKDMNGVYAISEFEIMLFSDGKQYTFKMFPRGVEDDYIALFSELANEEKSDYFVAGLALEEMSHRAKRGDLKPDEINAGIKSCDQLSMIPLTSLELQCSKLEECSIRTGDFLGIVIVRARLLWALGNATQAKTDLLDFAKKFLESDCYYPVSVYFDTYMLLSDICEASKEFDDAIVFLNMAANMENPDYQRQAKERLRHVDDLKTAHLPIAPHDRRSMILCADDVPTWPTKEFGFANSAMLLSTKWKFEMGHPQSGEMYICHPLRPDHYYAVQSFHDKLFDEKRTELVYLLESIGARHVHVEAMTGTSIKTQRDESISGKVTDGLVTGASAEIDQETHDTTKHNNLQSGVEDRELNPAPHPHIPNDLIWYPHETAWQRIAQSALDKRYKTLSVELRYHEDFSINQKRMTKVQGDLKLFAGNIEIGWKSDTEENLRLRKATSWKYTATFDDATSNRQDSQTKALSVSESEYLDDFKAALSDGDIVESTRRILERQRVKLGISVDRALKLEQSIKELCFSDEEKEYLQDLDDCHADGVIGDSERRMLMRRREKLNISVERALELEQISKIKH